MKPKRKAAKQEDWKQGYHQFLSDESKVLSYRQQEQKSTHQKVNHIDRKQAKIERKKKLNEFKEYLRSKQKELYSDIDSFKHATNDFNEKFKDMADKKNKVLAEMKQMRIVYADTVDVESDKIQN